MNDDRATETSVRSGTTGAEGLAPLLAGAAMSGWRHGRGIGMSKNLIGRAAVAAVLLLVSVAAFAQAGDPPARVGRISYIEGTVSYHAADQGDWSPATLNYPVIANQSYWTEPRSLLELQVGPAEFRLDEGTALDILLLDDSGSRLRLDQGVINIHLRGTGQGWVQVVTPAGYVDLVEPGSYDIDVGHPAPDSP